MGRRGPKPSPEPLKLLRDERKDRLVKPAKAATTGTTEPPSYLEGDALAKWLEMTADGSKLTPQKAQLLTIYCQAYARTRLAESMLRKPGADGLTPDVVIDCGNGGQKPHPALTVIKMCEVTMLRALADMARLDAESPAEVKADPIAAFKAKYKS